MNRGLVKTIIVLPGTVLVFIPAIILWVAKDSKFSADLISAGKPLFWLAIISACIGVILAIWTSVIFLKIGNGTPAPWDPPKKLVVRGPYRYVRNPMIIGVLCLLSAEALLLRSWPIAIWMIVFSIGNSVYFPVVEEKGLEKRFGDDYKDYRANVPRWLPRLRPWHQVNGDMQDGSSDSVSP